MNNEQYLFWSKFTTEDMEYIHHSTASIVELKFKKPREEGLTEIWLSYSELESLMNLLDELRKEI